MAENIYGCALLRRSIRGITGIVSWSRESSAVAFAFLRVGKPTKKIFPGIIWNPCENRHKEHGLSFHLGGTNQSYPCRIAEQLDETPVVAGGGHQSAVRTTIDCVDVGEVILRGPDAGQVRAQHTGLRVPVQQRLHRAGNQLPPTGRTVVVQQLSSSWKR